MTKGFMKDNKFRPIGSIGNGKSSRDKSILSEGVSIERTQNIPSATREEIELKAQREKFGSEFREKIGDELTEEIGMKWKDVIIKGTMHKLSKGFTITGLEDLIKNFRSFFEDTNWELIAKENGRIGIDQELRSIKKSSLLFTEERLKERFGFGEAEPRPTDKAEEIVQKLSEPFEQMRDEEFGDIKEREADFLMAKKIIADVTDEIQDEAQKKLFGGLKL